ncbi:MAG: SdpI family protein [Chloroflexota bacterium]|nr:SdpI family protein [Chloroflexota bacterium]
MRTSWKTEMPQLAIIAGLFAWSIYLWPIAPESLPVHFDLSGNVDRMGSKLEVLFAVPAVTLILYLVLRLLPRLDPARENYASFAGAYATLRLALVVMLALVDLAVLLPLVGVPIDQAAAIRLLLGGLLVAFGSVMGKIRPNWFVGIRTPWTLDSKESWVRTHRVGGWVFLLGGLTFIASLPLPTTLGLMLSFGVMAIGMVWIVVYSFLIWRRDPVRYPAIRSRPASK